MKNFKIILITVILTISIIVALQNKESVTAKFLFASLDMPLMLLIIVTFAAGFVAGTIISSLLRKKTKPQKE